MELFNFDFPKYWYAVKDGNKCAMKLYERHYSCYHYKDGRKRKLFVGPGEKMVLLTQNNDALFVWRKFIDDSGQRGINCSAFRNESKILSSDLIKEAVLLAILRWKEKRLYTYVDKSKIRSTNPGYCFKCAGWEPCGYTKKGLLILEKILEEV
jgi:hypothetical protein